MVINEDQRSAIESTYSNFQHVKSIFVLYIFVCFRPARLRQRQCRGDFDLRKVQLRQIESCTL